MSVQQPTIDIEQIVASLHLDKEFSHHHPPGTESQNVSAQVPSGGLVEPEKDVSRYVTFIMAASSIFTPILYLVGYRLYLVQ